MAFGGVDTGIMKPKLAPRHAPRAGGMGETPMPWATATITGITMLADVVLEVVSLTIMEMIVPAAVIVQRESRPSPAVMPEPKALASPVENMSFPMLRPPPKSIMVPQSIFAALSQLIVNLSSLRETGRTKRRKAAKTATTPSSSLEERNRTAPESFPRRRVKTLGVTQRMTAVPKATAVLTSPLFQPPSLPLASLIYSLIPGMEALPE